MTRLLLDEHLSGKAIGKALQESGHDVRAISGDKELEGLNDEGVLERAIREERVLLTANIVDFIPLITGLNKAGKSHPGCILIPNSFSNEDFGALISAIEQELKDTPEDDWTDRVKWARGS